MENNEVLRDVLNRKLIGNQELVNQALKVFAFYLAITGVLLKFALDKNSTPELKLVISILGISFSFIGFLTVFLANRLRNSIIKEIENLCNLLNIDFLPSTLLPLKYIEICSFLFAIITMVGWIYIVKI